MKSITPLSIEGKGRNFVVPFVGQFANPPVIARSVVFHTTWQSPMVFREVVEIATPVCGLVRNDTVVTIAVQ